MKSATIYLNGEPIGEASRIEYTIDGKPVVSPGVADVYGDAIVKANAATSEAIRGQSLTTSGPSSLMPAMVAHDIQALLLKTTAATFEASFVIDDSEFSAWVESLCFRLSRKQRRARKRWFQSIRRDLVRRAGSHKRWSLGWSRGMGLGPGFFGASVPRSLR